MASVKCGIGVVGVVVVACANVATTLAQSDELPRRLRERISRTLVSEGFPSAAAAFDTEVKLTVSDAPGFGKSVAISGDTAIVVEPIYTDLESLSGAVYVVRRNDTGGEAWGQVTKITASDGEDADSYGSSVAICGDTAIVGAHRSFNDFGNRSGAAYVYRKDEGGKDNWGEVTKIASSDTAGSGFGISVAISGDTVIVGALSDGGGGISSGAAYVYRRDEGGVDNWGEVSKITASDGVGYIRFGGNVALCGGTAIVGAPWDDDNGEFSGSAYVYQRDTGGTDNWGEVTKLIASDGAGSDHFGSSVAISGDTAIVGAPRVSESLGSGSAYVYQRDEGGADNWREVIKITASDWSDDDRFGGEVAISGDTAIVTARGDDDNGEDSGSAYVFRRDEGGTDNWGEVTRITASDGGARDSFGRSLAISNDTAIVGCSCGAAYVYFEACLDDAACADGDACNGAETCKTETGECLLGTPIQCDDGDDCNGVESCDPKTGDCIDGEMEDCDGNGIADVCELAGCGGDPGCNDCDANGRLDRCDIADGQPDVNGNGVIDTCESCSDNAACDDSEVCSFDRCINSLCWHDVDTRYGDVAGEEGVCGPDGDVNLSDILAVLDAFAGQYAEGCEPVNIDIAGDADSCIPDGAINLSDILGVLDAFQGSGNCCANAR